MPRKHPKEDAQEWSWGIRCVNHFSSFPLIKKEAVVLLWDLCGCFSFLPCFDPLLKPDLEQKLVWWPGFDPWGPVCQSAVEQATTTLWTDHLQLWATQGVILAGLLLIANELIPKFHLTFWLDCVSLIYTRETNILFLTKCGKYTFSVSLITLQFTSAPVCPSWARSIICIL